MESLGEQRKVTTQDLIQALLSPERQEELDPFVVITFMSTQPYDDVADIGCGPGYFSIPLAKHLSHGKLYALDVNDDMLDVLRTRVEEAKLGNVEILKCLPTEFPVPRESLDGVLLAFVLCQNDERVEFLKTVRDLLKPTGWCTVLEWYHKETESGPPVERRIDPGEMEGMAREAGFQFSWWRDMNGRQYMAMLAR